MIRSMTCFTRIQVTGKTGKWALEIRSLNNRYLDLSLRMPSALGEYESEAREIVQSKLRRGKVSLTISEISHKEEGKKLRLDPVRVRSALALFKKIKHDFKISGEITLRDVLNLPGVVESEESDLPAAKIWADVKPILQKALSEAVRARETEGRKLVVDVKNRLELISKAVDRVEEQSRGRSEETAAKLRERVRALMQDAAVPDDERFFREVAYLAERSDVTEEIVRLRSHLDLFSKKLTSGGEMGRELDFLCQELGREVNTIGSKAQLFEITKEVLGMKSELEKIREQIQNIE